MTTRRRRSRMSQRRGSKSAAARGFPAGGWRVTELQSCPTQPATCRGIPRRWKPRVARDMAAAPRLLWPGRDVDGGDRAVAPSRRPGSPAAAAIAVAAPAVAADLDGTRGRTPSGGRAPTAPDGTSAGTRSIAFGGTPSASGSASCRHSPVALVSVTGVLGSAAAVTPVPGNLGGTGTLLNRW